MATTLGGERWDEKLTPFDDDYKTEEDLELIALDDDYVREEYR